jgi:hypothetical protein
MKYFPLILLFVSFFSFTVSAQTSQNPACPTISVTGGRIVKPGEPLDFTVKVENYDLSKITFEWTVSGGKLIEGQGTTAIKVSKDNEDENITATVTVKGLPEGCPMNASETGSVCHCVHPILFNEFSIPASQIDKARLDNLVKEIADNPSSQIYIIEYFKRGTAQKIIDRKIQKITDYLVYERQIEKERITILTDSEIDMKITRFWLVPPGAEPPKP